MNGYFSGDSTDFFFQNEETKTTNSSSQQWIEKVFDDPTNLAQRIPLDLFNAENLTFQQEATLYLDWQTRDTELGYRLIDRRREELSRSSESFRNLLGKKRKAATFTRTRLEALQKINAAELNPSLKHPKHIFAQLETEVRTIQEELQTLRYHLPSIEALNIFLKPVDLSNSGNQFLSEQRMRLLGQSWRGWMRIQAFKQTHPNYQFPLPSNPDLPNPLFPGFTLIVPNDLPNPLGTDLVIGKNTSAYLHYCLQSIKNLSQEATQYFQGKKLTTPNWSTIMFLLRAIVEVFYFCWFELPIMSNSLIVDIDEPNKFWRYQTQDQQWQPINIEPINQKLKREAASLSYFISTNTSLCSWQSPENIDIAVLATDPSRRGLQPYRSTGLSFLELNPTTYTHKFQSGYKLTGKVLEQIVNADDGLKEVFNTSLGGVLETLANMAMLDSKAFVGATQPMVEEQQLKYLSQFWKAMGKRRPTLLLGEKYAKTLNKKFTDVGEPIPEKVSQLSIQLSAVLSRVTILGEQSKPGIEDLLAKLGIADQIRFVELANSTWSFIEEIINSINSLEVGSNLSTTICLLPDRVSQYEEAIGKRFFPKWATTQQPIWQVLAASIPMTWDFWIKLASNQPWAASLTLLSPEDAIVTLLSLCADVIRLLIMLESASPTAAERLIKDAEGAGVSVLAAFQRYQNSLAVVELIRYYYDTEISHDGWIAFTSSFKAYLQQLQGDLNKLGATEQEKIIANILKQLEINYPTPIVAKKAIRKSSIVPRILDATSLSFAVLEEKDVQNIEIIANELIGQSYLDPLLFMKIVSLFQVPELNERLLFLATNQKPLKERFLNAKHRRLLVILPSVTKNITEYLRNLGLSENSSVLSSEIVFQLEEYLTQTEIFNNYVESALNEVSEIPLEDLAEIENLEKNSRVNLIIFLVSNRIFASLVREKISSTIERFKDTLKSFAVGQLADWTPEYLVLGAVGIRNQNGLIVIGNSEISVDPLFVESNKELSENCMSAFVRYKYRMVKALIERSLPGSRVIIQLS